MPLRPSFATFYRRIDWNSAPYPRNFVGTPLRMRGFGRFPPNETINSAPYTPTCDDKPHLCFKQLQSVCAAVGVPFPLRTSETLTAPPNRRTTAESPPSTRTNPPPSEGPPHTFPRES
ncbi:MAG: hypothetical protein ACTS6P_01365 [Candidatus Hodgkinia cicadicola]